MAEPTAPEAADLAAEVALATLPAEDEAEVEAAAEVPAAEEDAADEVPAADEAAEVAADEPEAEPPVTMTEAV